MKATAVLCGSSSAVIAVSLIIRCASRTSDLQQLDRVLLGRHVALEQLLRGEDDLVGGLAPAALAAHAVGDDGEQAARHARMVEDLDAVLLVGAVAPVRPRHGGQSVTC